MKSLKTVGLTVLAALITMALTGTSPAMAEPTQLCKDKPVELQCSESITHVHEETLTGSKAKLLLGSVGTVECNALFLGNTLGLGEPLVIHGDFSYSDCLLGGTNCTETEVSADSLVEVLRLGDDLADVTYKFEINVHCGIFVNCTYNGTNLKGHALDPAISSFENGDVTLNEQTLNKVSGLCPSTSKLDISTMPLEKVYIGK